MLKDSFYKAIRIIEKSETSVRLGISLNPEHPIFEGHFPGNPVTPGAAMIQMLKELVAEHLHKTVRLVEVRQIKFLNILSPGETADLEMRFELEPDDASIQFGTKAVIKDARQTYMKFTGRFEVDS